MNSGSHALYCTKVLAMVLLDGNGDVQKIISKTGYFDIFGEA